MAFGRSSKTNTERGYGTEHQAARAAAALTHQPTDPCARCRRPLGPMGEWLHYDHNAQRTGYLGFSHARCNRRAGAREGRRRQSLTPPRAVPPPPLKTSRTW